MSKSKYLDLAGLTAYDRKLKEWFKAGVVDITNDAINALFPVIQPNNEIWYTSTDGNVISYNDYVVSNTYENGKGIITFDRDVNIIVENAFYNNTKLTSISIPETVTAIYKNAFRGCTSLQTINWPANLEYIADYAFHNCKKLNNTVNIPDGVLDIPLNAFGSCTSLKNVVIGNGITILKQSFSYCTNLTNVTLPASIKTIQGWVFEGCNYLKSINFNGTKSQWNSITKDTNWNVCDISTGERVPASYVQCSDGQVTL